MSANVYVKGYSLLFAIVVTIIVSSAAFLFLSYFNINYLLLDKTGKIHTGRIYGYNGIALQNAAIAYDQPYNYSTPDGFKLNVLKKKWGVFDMCFSTVSTAIHDTIFSKIALVGYQKDTTIDIAIYLRKNPSLFSVGDSVTITGKCYIPYGKLKDHGKPKDGTPLLDDQLVPSPDTFIILSKMDSISAWLKLIDSSHLSQLTIDDTIFNSFRNPTITLSADTVSISGSLSGNIIVTGSKINVRSSAQLHDVIIVGSSVSIADSFRGSCQLFGYDSISIGDNCTFDYPSATVLLPELSKDPDYITTYHYISVGSNLEYHGEIYAYSFRSDIAGKTSVTVQQGSIVTGGIYSSGIIQWSGQCMGTLICDKLMSAELQTLQANFMIKSKVIPVNEVFSYSNIYPFCGQKKIVTWLQ